MRLEYHTKSPPNPTVCSVRNPRTGVKNGCSFESFRQARRITVSTVIFYPNQHVLYLLGLAFPPNVPHSKKYFMSQCLHREKCLIEPCNTYAYSTLGFQIECDIAGFTTSFVHRDCCWLLSCIIHCGLRNCTITINTVTLQKKITK